MKITTIILIIFFIGLIIFFAKKNQIEAMYVMSDIDKKSYLVRNEEDKEQAANVLAKLRKNLYYLRDYLYKNVNSYSPEYQKYIRSMHKRMEGMVISENTPDSNFTSYTVNKGDEMLFCIRSKKDSRIHNFNLLMYVALHEVSHVACPEEGHTPLFGEIFAFMLSEGIKIGIYKNIDYGMNPVEYCGMTINEAPRTDLNLSYVKKPNSNENKE